jgi:hypothetical protein
MNREVRSTKPLVAVGHALYTKIYVSCAVYVLMFNLNGDYYVYHVVSVKSCDRKATLEGNGEGLRLFSCEALMRGGWGVLRCV